MPKRSITAITTTEKVKIRPLRKGEHSHSTEIALPLRLGRKALCSLWWDACSKSCNIKDPRKVHGRQCCTTCSTLLEDERWRELSTEMLEINVRGRVDVKARHKELVNWDGEPSLDYSTRRFHIGDRSDPWMSFEISRMRAVTPDDRDEWLSVRKYEKRVKPQRLDLELSMENSSLPDPDRFFNEDEESPYFREKLVAIANDPEVTPPDENESIGGFTSQLSAGQSPRRKLLLSEQADPPHEDTSYCSSVASPPNHGADSPTMYSSSIAQSTVRLSATTSQGLADAEALSANPLPWETVAEELLQESYRRVMLDYILHRNNSDGQRPSEMQWLPSIMRGVSGDDERIHKDAVSAYFRTP